MAVNVSATQFSSAGFVGTVALFGGWASRFYATGAAALTELYLVLFVALYGWLDFSVASGKSIPARRHLLGIVAIVLFFFASDLNLDHNATSFWGFLAAFAAAAVGWSFWKRERFAANGALVLTAVAVAAWLPGHFRTADAYTVALFATLTLGIFLAHQVFGSKWALTPGPPDVVVALGTAFGYFGVMYTALRQLFPDSMGLMAVALAVPASAELTRRTRTDLEARVLHRMIEPFPLPAKTQLVNRSASLRRIAGRLSRMMAYHTRRSTLRRNNACKNLPGGSDAMKRASSLSVAVSSRKRKMR